MKAAAPLQHEAPTTAVATSASKATLNPLQLKTEVTAAPLHTTHNPLAAINSAQNPLQLLSKKQSQSGDNNPLQLKANKTGLPDQLKAGVESLSGYSMDDVRVHYNSGKPAQLQALAYAQGTDIHVAPGQEKHLPHEAWHVVQQKQGRVQPTLQILNINLNNDEKLESEANRFQSSFRQINPEKTLTILSKVPNNSTSTSYVVQLVGKQQGQGKKQAKPKKRKLEEDDNLSETEVNQPQKKKKVEHEGLKSEDVSKLDEILVLRGAQQQGRISKPQGKQYVGPETFTKKRAMQVTRHITNLILNRLTNEQVKQDGKKPVEIQMSSVGGVLLLSTNQREASKALYESMKNERGVFNYINNVNAFTPIAGDADEARPKSNFAKIEAASKRGRHWQEEGNLKEDKTDVNRADAILKAIITEEVGLLDPDNKQQFEDNLKNFGKHKVYVVLHSSTRNIKGEHAERVQSEIRVNHLKEYENDLSTPPGGPKTTCLGCASEHEAKYSELGLESKYNGAYFEKTSPAIGKAEDIAVRLVNTRPSTGSISKEGYMRNSDYPDSDTDNEGNLVFPRPLGFRVAHDEDNPTEMEWYTAEDEIKSFAPRLKRNKIIEREQRLKRSKQRKQERDKQKKKERSKHK